MISLIHPSRSRPERSRTTIDNWLKKSGIDNPIEIIYSLDYDDPFLHKYGSPYRFAVPLNGMVIKNRNKNAVEAINRASVFASGNILIVVSDDTDCPENWAKTLLEITAGKEDFIIKAQDGIQDWIITMPIMDRKYFNRFGYIYHPSYEHCFCDTELTCVAELTGRLIVRHDLFFLHKHYSIGFNEKDSLNDKADATFESGKANFIRRKAFDFDLQNPPGKLSNNVYTRMS